MREFTTVNPANGRPVRTYTSTTPAEVATIIEAAAAAAAGPWAALSPTRRGRLLFAFADIIRAHADELARLESGENGKLLREARMQMGWLEEWLYYYGGLADKIIGKLLPHETPAILNYTLREPVGVVGVITPWNSPASLTMAHAAPAMAAGNAVVVKPSEVTPAVVLRLAELALEAGIPEGVFSVVIGGRETGLALAGHPLIGKLAFTGSVDAGRAIAAAAGERLVGVTLELGGKSPNIVFADADVDRAEAGVLNGIFAAAGQTCVAGSRCYVEKGLFDEFLARLKRRAEGIRVGDPLDPQSHVGPIATEPQFRKDISLVDQARGEGAEVVTGGHPLQPGGEAGGYYYAPTILVPRDPATAILRTEVFGPVLSIMPFSGEDELVAMANDSPFGLAAGVWTRDISRAHRMARRLEAGTVWINMYRAFKVLSPMGGHKQSGIGHQNGPDAMDQYLKTKSVWVDTAESFMDPMA